VRDHVAASARPRLENDQGRLKHHVLPVIGDLVLADVRAPHIVDLFHKMRFTSERKLAQRSIYNIYSVVLALFSRRGPRRVDRATASRTRPSRRSPRSRARTARTPT
jgi:hypothetical protein